MNLNIINKKIQSAFLLGSLFLGLVACETTKKAGGIDLSLMDTEVRPQDNFYNYVNGTWMKNTEIPDDKTRGEVSMNYAKTLMLMYWPF